MSRSAKAPRRRGQGNHMFKVGWARARPARAAAVLFGAPRAARDGTASPTTRKGGYHNSPNSDFCNWRKK